MSFTRSVIIASPRCFNLSADERKVLCFSYFDNMFALGFSKDEAENIRSEDAGETKDQASGSKFIKFYGKSR